MIMKSYSNICIKCIILPVIIFLFLATPLASIYAQSLQDARLLFSQGKWIEAAKLAKSEGSGEGLALAAQITSYYGRFIASEDEQEEIFSRSIKLSSKAIEISPNSAFAHLQKAHAMGRYSQTVGILEALSEGYAGKIFDSVSKALSIEPEYASAYALMGNWHAEIIDSAGFVGRMVYGASESESLENFKKAIRIEPNNFLIRLEFANGLLKLDDDYKNQATAQLKMLAEATPKNSLEKIINTQAKKMLNKLELEN